MAQYHLEDETWSPHCGDATDHLLRKERDSEADDGEEDDRPHCYIPRRYILVAVLFAGCSVAYGLRVCISVAAAPVSADGRDNMSMYNEFGWSDTDQGWVLSAFFGGYISTQILGGLLAKAYGGKVVIGCGIGLASLATLATPLLAANFRALIVLRVLTGAASGVTYPCIMTFLGLWTQKSERSFFVSIVFSGGGLGTVSAMILGGGIMENAGWRWVFVFYGVCGLLWCILLACLVASSPACHSTIHVSERRLLVQPPPPDGEKASETTIPWKKILLSRPVWAIFIAHFSFNFGFYLMVTELPSYLSTVHHLSITRTALSAALPYFAQFIVSNVAGILADHVIANGWVSTVCVRKVAMTTGMLIPAMSLVAVGYVQSGIASVALLTLSVGALGICHSGYGANYLEVSRSLSGVLLSIGNTFATLPGILAPLITGFVLESYGCLPGVAESACAEAYEAVFLLAFAQYALGVLFFVAWATSECVLP